MRTGDCARLGVAFLLFPMLAVFSALGGMALILEEYWTLTWLLLSALGLSQYVMYTAFKHIDRGVIEQQFLDISKQGPPPKSAQVIR